MTIRVGERHELILMPRAGRDELVPETPIVVRPAYRVEARRRSVDDVIADAIDRALRRVDETLFRALDRGTRVTAALRTVLRLPARQRSVPMPAWAYGGRAIVRRWAAIVVPPRPARGFIAQLRALARAIDGALWGRARVHPVVGGIAITIILALIGAVAGAQAHHVVHLGS